MAHILTLEKIDIKTQIFTIITAVITAVALPHVFHQAGIIFGLGSALGETFLPMQLPVILAGLFAGPIIGLTAGIMSPLVSFAISGMPVEAMLPFIVIELAGYGLAAGILGKARMPVFCKLLIIQVTGRTLRSAAILAAVYGLGSQNVDVSRLWSSITVGLPGIMLQWCLIPLVMRWMRNMNKSHE